MNQIDYMMGISRLLDSALRVFCRFPYCISYFYSSILYNIIRAQLLNPSNVSQQSEQADSTHPTRTRAASPPSDPVPPS